MVNMKMIGWYAAHVITLPEHPESVPVKRVVPVEEPLEDQPKVSVGNDPHDCHSPYDHCLKHMVRLSAEECG